MKYIAILRGINVGGKKVIKMAFLKSIFEQLNFEKVETYIQSGNVIFETTILDKKEMIGQIQKAIEEQTTFDVNVLLYSHQELEEIINQNPYQSEIEHVYVTFLSEQVQHFEKKVIDDKKQEGEMFEINKSVVYLFCPIGYGKTKITNTFLEKKLNLVGSTRNLKTCIALEKMAKK